MMEYGPLEAPKSERASETASVSLFLPYPPRFWDLEPPDWARKHFMEHEIAARVALGGSKRLEVQEVLRERLPNGDVGAWWACEVVLKRGKSRTMSLGAAK